MSEPSLKPCPHCGCEDVRTPTVAWNGTPIPRCGGCRAEAPSAETWNRRAPAERESAGRKSPGQDHSALLKMTREWMAKGYPLEDLCE